MLRKTLKEIFSIFVLGLFLVSVEVLAQSANPPSGNAPAPLNVSSSGQSKSGGLILNTGGATNGLIVEKGNVGIGTANPTVKLQVAGDIKTSGSIVGSGSPVSGYGATALYGDKNNWGGINFRRSSGANLGTLMVHEDYQGFYNNSDNGWDWYFQNGTMQAGTIPWARISGAPSAEGIPSGLIALFSSGCPSGWSRFTALDGRYPRGSSSYGATGGSSSHSHSGNTSTVGSHRHSIPYFSWGGNNNVTTAIDGSYATSHNDYIERTEKNTGYSGDHSHSFTTSSESGLDPYRDMVFCQKN